MAIVITDAKEPLKLTQSQFDRLMFEYEQSFKMYFGKPPAFEDWARDRINGALTNFKGIGFDNKTKKEG